MYSIEFISPRIAHLTCLWICIHYTQMFHLKSYLSTHIPSDDCTYMRSRLLCFAPQDPAYFNRISHDSLFTPYIQSQPSFAFARTAFLLYILWMCFSHWLKLSCMYFSHGCQPSLQSSYLKFMSRHRGLP